MSNLVITKIESSTLPAPEAVGGVMVSQIIARFLKELLDNGWYPVQVELISGLFVANAVNPYTHELATFAARIESVDPELN